METNGDFLKLAKAKLSQKYYEEVKQSVEKGVDVDDSVFNLADFNNDGKVDSDDKDLFEEYITSYSELFGDSDFQDTASVNDILYSLEAENVTTAQSTQTLSTSADNDSSGIANDESENSGEVNQAKIGELKEKYGEIQEQLNKVKEKYQKAVKNKNNAKKHLQAASSNYTSSKTTYDSANSSYQEALRKKMSKSSKSSSNKTNSSDKSDEQYREAKKNRDKALRDMSLKQSAYSLASSNVTFYDSASLNYKSEYNSIIESYGAFAEEFNTAYNSLTDAEKAIFGANPFDIDSTDEA